MLGGWELRRLSWLSWVLFNELKNGNKARKHLHFIIFFSGKHIYIYTLSLVANTWDHSMVLFLLYKIFLKITWVWTKIGSHDWMDIDMYHQLDASFWVQLLTGSWFMAAINWWPVMWSSSSWREVGKFLPIKLVNPKILVLEGYVWSPTTKQRKMFRHLITTFKKGVIYKSQLLPFLSF